MRTRVFQGAGSNVVNFSLYVDLNILRARPLVLTGYPEGQAPLTNIQYGVNVWLNQ